MVLAWEFYAYSAKKSNLLAHCELERIILALYFVTIKYDEF
jgi:hypothetical protein